MKSVNNKKECLFFLFPRSWGSPILAWLAWVTEKDNADKGDIFSVLNYVPETLSPLTNVVRDE